MRILVGAVKVRHSLCLTLVSLFYLLGHRNQPSGTIRTFSTSSILSGRLTKALVDIGSGVSQAVTVLKPHRPI